MNRDHLLGWPPSLLALDPEPRKSLRTPVPARLTDREQEDRRLIDKTTNHQLTALVGNARFTEYFVPWTGPAPDAPSVGVAKPVESAWLYFRGIATGRIFRRARDGKTAHVFIASANMWNTYRGADIHSPSRASLFDPITIDQLPKGVLP